MRDLQRHFTFDKAVLSPFMARTISVTLPSAGETNENSLDIVLYTLCANWISLSLFPNTPIKRL